MWVLKIFYVQKIYLQTNIINQKIIRIIITTLGNVILKKCNFEKKQFLKSLDLTEIQIVHHNNLFPSSRRQKQNQNSASLNKIQEGKVFGSNLVILNFYLLPTKQLSLFQLCDSNNWSLYLYLIFVLVCIFRLVNIFCLFCSSYSYHFSINCSIASCCSFLL